MRIGLLGTLQVRDDSGAPVRAGGHRVRSLLILLALEPGRVVPATSLIGRLWPDDPPGDAGNALQTLVSRLRAALRGTGVIESHPVGYRLVIDPGDVDSVAFETLVRQATGPASNGATDPSLAASLLREALALWRGPALADVADEEFARGPAARLEEARLAALHDRIEADLALGESASLVGELRSLIAANPLAERSRVLLMRALQAAGRQADALAVYTEARELLATELGVDPSPDLERTHLDVLRQNYSPKRRTAGPLATPASPPARKPRASFVGRDDDLTGVRERLGEYRLVTLTGPGGIGKTRLAAEATATLDGAVVHTAELAKVTAGAEVPFAVLDAIVGRERSIARRTGEPAGVSDPLRRISAALADRDTLVVLDNCEHLIDAAAGFADWMLMENPRVKILATSREPLRIAGEVLWPVAPLAEDASVRLLGDRAAAVRPGFAVDELNSGVVSRICRALDGMPLAIELAAARLRMLSPDQLAERLDDRFTVLTGGSRSALPRHQTLRAVVEWSWDSLSKPERILARRLAVFPGGVTLEAAEGVCADESLPASAILEALSGLVDKSILVAGTGTRYRMLETIRAYGEERLAEAGEHDGVRAEFRRYYLRLAEAADPLLRGPEQNRWLTVLNAELDNIHAAIRMAIAAGDTMTALRFIRALGWWWMIQSNGEAESLAREVLRMPADDSGPLIAEARVICALSAAGQSWDVEAVREDFEAAVRRFNECCGDSLEVHPLAAFGEPMLALSDLDPERALTLMERYADSPDSWERAGMTVMRGQFCAMVGRHSEAEELVIAATEQLRSIGDAYMLRSALAMVADFKAISGDREGAIAALREAVGACDPPGATELDQGYFEARLAGLHIRMGDFAAAREHLELAGDLRAKNADTGMWLGIIWAELAWAEGDNDEAARRCEAILAELDTRTSMWWGSFRATVQARLAAVALQTGDRPRARDLLATAPRGAADWVEQPPLATVIDTVAVLVVDDDPALAATLLGAAHTLRGQFDESSLDAPAARDAARRALAESAYDAAYQRGRDLSHDQAVALARSACGDQALRR
jgi:predicted ATPase/DNA-binding SARP family transcriptional activator